MLRGNIDHIVRRAVNGQVGHIERLSVDGAIHIQSEQLSKGRGIDVCGRENRFRQVRALASVVVLVGVDSHRDWRRRWRRWLRCCHRHGDQSRR